MEKGITGKLADIAKRAAENGIKDLKITTKQEYAWRKSVWIEKPIMLNISGFYDRAQVAQAEKYKEKEKELLEKTGVRFNIDIHPCLKGVQFPTVDNLNPTQENFENSFTVHHNEVTLFDFWATWCGPCQEPMAHNQEMLEKHPEWIGKARIVAFSIDNDFEKLKELTIEKNFTKVEHYMVNNSWKSEICKFLCITSIPFCVLVDKKGIIRLVGHPSTMNIEENINLLIKNSAIKEGSLEEAEGNAIIDKSFSYEVSKLALDGFVKIHQEVLKNFQFPIFEAVSEKEFENGKFEEFNSFVICRFKYSPKYKGAADKLKEDFNNRFKSKIQIKISSEELMIVKYGIKCTKCGKSLGICDQYRCIICPDQYFCVSCAENNPNPTDLNDLVHPHALLFLVKGSEFLLDKGICKCEANDSPNFTREHEGSTCDYCEKTPVGNRWKCLFCQNFDICDACIKIGRDIGHPKNKEIVNKSKDHDFTTHSYIRIDFDSFIEAGF